jgi:hypothetical protein
LRTPAAVQRFQEEQADGTQQKQVQATSEEVSRHYACGPASQ